MGLMAWVYRNGLGGSTNGGISATAKAICIVNIDGPFEPAPDMPAALLVENTCFGPGRGLVKIVACDENGVQLPGWAMFGGNYASGDSRFDEAVKAITGQEFVYGPVPIHDRYE